MSEVNNTELSITPSIRQWVEIRTMLPTVPYPTLSARPNIETERLLLRPLSQSDIVALHQLRAQPEVMAWSSRGKPNSRLEETQQELDSFLLPHADATLGYAICLRATEEMIGIGGSHRREGSLGWPVLSYSLRKEFWGKGYASEFLGAFLKIWRGLPRAETSLIVDNSTIAGRGGLEDESVTATTSAENIRSQRVMKKSKMVLKRAWEEDNLAETGQRITMLGFAATV